MHYLALMVFVLGFSLASTAEPIRPFIGGSFGITTVNNNYLMQKNITGSDLQDHSGTDFQIELGAATDTYMGYFAYRSGSASYDDLETIDQYYRGFYIGTDAISSSDITSTHIMLGGRLELKTPLPEIIRPVIGLGVARSTIKREFKWTPTNFYMTTPRDSVELSESVESDSDWGGMMELGIAFRPKMPFQVLLTYQIVAARAKFDTYQASPLANQYEIRENAIQLGIIYHFKKLGESE